MLEQQQVLYHTHLRKECLCLGYNWNSTWLSTILQTLAKHRGHPYRFIFAPIQIWNNIWGTISIVNHAVRICLLAGSDDVGLPHHACRVGGCHALVGGDWWWWWARDGQGWWWLLLRMMVVVEKEWHCLLMMPRSNVSKCWCSIWTSSTCNDSVLSHSRQYSFWVIPRTIPAEFEFHLKFHWNCLISWAGPWAKIDYIGISGIARMLLDSGRNQCRTIKTSNQMARCQHTLLFSGKVATAQLLYCQNVCRKNLWCLIIEMDYKAGRSYCSHNDYATW